MNFSQMRLPMYDVRGTRYDLGKSRALRGDAKPERTGCRETVRRRGYKEAGSGKMPPVYDSNASALRARLPSRCVTEFLKWRCVDRRKAFAVTLCRVPCYTESLMVLYLIGITSVDASSPHCLRAPRDSASALSIRPAQSAGISQIVNG